MVQKVFRFLIVLAALYIAAGLAFHFKWKSELDACRAVRKAQGEFVEPEVFGGVLGLYFTVTNWPVYAWANFYHDGTIFATPCTHSPAFRPAATPTKIASFQPCENIALSTQTPLPTPFSSSSSTTAPPLPEMPFENRLFQQGGTYILQYRDALTQIQYRYTPRSGSLNDLEVIIGEEPPFLPSHYGGPRFWVQGQDIPIWETEPEQLRHTVRLMNNNTLLEVLWQAQFGQTTIPYTYRFSIQGKTLHLEVESPSTALSAFTLDRSAETQGGRILAIPYLPLFNLLLYREHFLSAYFDWQVSNASRLEPMNQLISETSQAFSQTAYYLPNTLAARQPLHEVIYMTVSDTLAEVLPRLPNAPSPYRRLLAGKVLLDLWAERPFAEDAQFLQELAEQGIPDLIVVRHNWQRCGYDDCYPSVLPANPLWGGDAPLQELSQAAQQAGYLFALHENYVDYYPNAVDFSADLLALDSSGKPIPAWFNHTTRIQSFLLSPLHSVKTAARFAPEIHRRYHTSATYLDVSTAVNPSEKVDYNAALQGSARLRTTLEAYRQLLQHQRQTHQAPVIGEGGHHFLYAGTADAVIAEDENRPQAGTLIPPIVHFDLLRIHPLMQSFGVGLYPWFFAQGDQPQWFGYTDEEHYRYMASEIAFCHGGYIPTPDSLGEKAQALAFIEQEVKLVASVHQRCALANPLSIRYHVNGEMVGVERALIENQPWQVMIAYDNGLEIWVNLHPTQNWLVTLARTPEWVNYSALVEGQRQDGVGAGETTTYLLPPNGWVVWQ